MAIEVDGYTFHKAGSKQSERDKMKNEIMEKYGIDLLRCKTTGSGEKEEIVKQLETILNK